MAHTRRKTRPMKLPTHSFARAVAMSRPRIGKSTMVHVDKRNKLRCKAERKDQE